jgi:NAD(P)H-dependent FMN reductase
MTKKVQLIVGSTRQNRLSPTIAEWIKQQVAGYEELDLEVVDLKEVNLPLFDEPLPPSMAPASSPAANAWRATVEKADAFIVLTSEYNAGYPAPLKNAIDYLKTEWQNRPLAIVSYGFGGGVSAATQLKQVFERIKADIVKQSVNIDLGPILNDKGGITDPTKALGEYEAPLQAALDEIVAHKPVEVEAETAA